MNDESPRVLRKEIAEIINWFDGAAKTASCPWEEYIADKVAAHIEKRQQAAIKAMGGERVQESVVVEEAKEEWCVSRDEEHYTGGCGSREEAIAELDGEHGWIGKSSRITIKQLFPCIDRLFEHMEERAYDYAGDVSKIGFTGTNDKEKIKELHAEMIGLFDKYGIRPRFYAVDDVEEIPPSPSIEGA